MKSWVPNGLCVIFDFLFTLPKRRQPSSPKTSPMWREQRQTAWNLSAKSPNPAPTSAGSEETRSCPKADGLSTLSMERRGSSWFRIWSWLMLANTTADWVQLWRPQRTSPSTVSDNCVPGRNLTENNIVVLFFFFLVSLCLIQWLLRLLKCKKKKRFLMIPQNLQPSSSLGHSLRRW